MVITAIYAHTLAMRTRQCFTNVLYLGTLFCLIAKPVLLTSAQNTSTKLSSQDVNQLVREVVRNEIDSEVRDHSLWRYRAVREESGKKKTFDVCQTKEGEIQHLIAINGQPLRPKQQQAEDQRIQKLVRHPDQLQQLKKKQSEDADQIRNLLKMFPEAFQFQPGGMQGNLIRVNFTPNPKFRPATRPAHVFHHMKGHLLIDGKEKRIVEINGQLTDEVKFGGGILGHLDKGGTFTVKQQDVGSGHWEVTSMDINMNGKVLFFKTLSVRQKETYTDFRRLPDNIPPSQAVELLIKDNKIEKAKASD
jgi:hypothetical protein